MKLALHSTFFTVSLVICWTMVSSSQPANGALGAEASKRPNILWLVGEDLGPHLGCYGTKEVWTPNLDRLAAAGVRYTRFYNGHVCSPSRSAFMTGMYATTIGAHNHRSHREDGYKLPEGVRVLTDWLRGTRATSPPTSRAAAGTAVSRALARRTGISLTKASRSTRRTGTI